MNDNTVENADIDSKKEDSKLKWKKHLPLYIIEMVVLLVVVIGAVFIRNLTKVEKVNLDTTKIEYNEIEEATEEEEEIVLDNNDYIQDGDFDTKEEEVDIDKEAIENELYERCGGNFMIAFFGVDSREGSLGAGTRSDSMIVCAIDMNSHKVKLISLYRDTYLNLGNNKYNKCNAAYAIGGPEQALSMINKNTDLYVDQYITIGFEGLIDSINALGGIPIDVKEDEIFHLNNYQIKMAEELGLDYTPVVYPGTQMLNGLQATAYCRIRYTQGDDFKRAERQRDVIEAMLKRSGSVSLAAMTDAVTKILPNVSTSLSVNDIVAMMSLASDYEVTVSDGFPFEGMRNGGPIGSIGSCVVPTDLTKNVKHLHKLLFDDDNYQPSSAVIEYSNRIKNDTDEFLMY